MEMRVKLDDNLDNLSESQKNAVMETERAVEIAANRFNSYSKLTNNLRNITIIFSDSLGRIAGKANYYTYILQYNNNMLEENEYDFISNTIYHEVAHLIAGFFISRKEKSHGRTWKWVMQDVFNLEPTLYHNYNPQTSVESKLYEYICICGTNFYLSKNLHSKICNGVTRVCKKCKTPVVYIGE